MPYPEFKQSNSRFIYAILGAGRQGTAAAYDLARFGEAKRIILADSDAAVAEKAADRVNALIGEPIARGAQLDVRDREALEELLGPVHCALSAVPYYFNVEITEAAIATQTHLCDLGGNTEIVRKQLAMDKEASSAGISVVPDCGMGPGLINTMGAYAIDLLDEPQEIYIYDAGLPLHPAPPWNYQLTFHINGLTNEMDGQAVFLRDGKIVHVDTLSEPEFIDFPPFGSLEADVTSGGTSTAPWTFQGKVHRYENKVLRIPGHYEWLRAYKTLGLFREDSINVNGQSVVPRKVYHALLEPQITADEINDVGIIRARGVGLKGGKPTSVVIDLIDYFDETTGFTAMERLTGWHCSVMMTFQVRGSIATGVTPVEIAVPPAEFMDALALRGIKFDIRYE